MSLDVLVLLIGYASFPWCRMRVQPSGVCENTIGGSGLRTLRRPRTPVSSDTTDGLRSSNDFEVADIVVSVPHPICFRNCDLQRCWRGHTSQQKGNSQCAWCRIRHRSNFAAEKATQRSVVCHLGHRGCRDCDDGSMRDSWYFCRDVSAGIHHPRASTLGQ